MEHFFSFIVNLVKLPFVAIFKTLFTVFNLIPLPVYELHGILGNNEIDRPDLRETYIKIKGSRRVHLGSFIIAWTRGSVFRAHLNSQGTTCLGVYSEDYKDIQKNWVW